MARGQVGRRRGAVLGGNPSARSEDVTEEEVRDIIATPVESEEQRTILSGAFEAAERTLREIVVPRSQVLALPIDLPAAEARAELVGSGHTRAPVYAGDLDDVRGVVHLIDLLDAEGPVSDARSPSDGAARDRSACSTPCAGSGPIASRWRWWSTSTAPPRAS